jgi:glycine oxidase
MSVVVIGGGLCGLLSAWRLAQRGMDVTVVEMGVLGSGASTAAAGMLSPQAEYEVDGPLFRFALRARERHFQVAAELGANAVRCGLAYVALDEVQARKLKERVAWQQAAGCKAMWNDDARVVHDDVSAEMAGVALFADEGCVAPRELFPLVIAAVRASGVKIIEHERVRSVQEGFTVILEKQTLRAKQVVIAGGAWSTRIPVLSAGGADARDAIGMPETSVEPVRGVLMEAEWSPLNAIIALRGGYVVPRGGLRVVVGSSSEDAGFDAEVTQDAVASLEARVHRVVPSLGNARIIGKWAGLRPYARRERPIVSESKIPGLFYATGHYRNGILLAPLSADVLVARVTAQTHQDAELLSL